MNDLIEWFNYDGVLSPEVYFKYILFLTIYACMCRLIGEILNSLK